MAWEERQPGGLYYYRRQRIGSRWIRQYVGTGLAAEAAAQRDAAKRAERQQERKAEQARRAAYDAAQTLLAELSRQADVLVRAALCAAGYYQHDRGQWRRRHVYNTRR